MPIPKRLNFALAVANCNQHPQAIRLSIENSHGGGIWLTDGDGCHSKNWTTKQRFELSRKQWADLAEEAEFIAEEGDHAD